MYNFVITVMILSLLYTIFFLLRLFFDEKPISLTYFLSALLAAGLSIWAYFLVS